MIISPLYDGPPALVIDGSPGDEFEPLARQRRRMQDTLAGLTDEQWAMPSRCDVWRVRDVVTHLNSVNPFWTGSVAGGLAGTPTRFLVGFDPNATPALLVELAGQPGPAEVLAQFVATNEALIAALEPLTDEQWMLPVETPVGHPAIRVLAAHALWDCWIHERDVIVPLGIEPAIEPDEVSSCLRFAAAVGPALALGQGTAQEGVYAVEATNPDVCFVLDVSDTVTVKDAPIEESMPVLRGDAVALIEALSLRAPLPADAPAEWSALLGGLTAAFS